MKFTDVKTLEHLLKEYSYNSSGKPTPSGEQKMGGTEKNTGAEFATVNIGDVDNDTKIKDLNGDPLGTVVSPVGKFPDKNNVVVQTDNDQLQVIDDGTQVDIDSDDKKNESKLSKLAKRKNKKHQIKKIRSKLKKLARRRLKEQPAELFEINFNKKEIAIGSLDLPVKCGFEAETFFYSVDNSSSSDVDEMSVSDIEYEYGDLPDGAYEDYNQWLYDKGQEEYLDDLIDDKVQEFKEDEDYINDFIDSGGGPSSEAVERYKNNFEEEDPKEYENREEDGWEYINWCREFVEEEYEEEYLAWLRNEVAEENDLDEEAKELAEADYSMDEWVNDNYSYMSSFLDDYGYEYGSTSNSVEGVADELMVWIRDNSEFQNYPESGDYGDTNTTTGWAVENDSSIEPDEGAAAELISPVFASPRIMLEEMRSLFEWSEKNFGTNSSTGLHVTMSWHGEAAGLPSAAEPNKLKMALLLGDEYLLAEFGRLRNSYAKSQYKNIVKYAERMKKGDAKSFEEFEKALSKGVSDGKFNSIHFKSEKDRMAGTNLMEFRIAGGTDYNTMFEKVVKAVVRYATIMKAGYDENAFRTEYINAVSRVLRKANEINPKKLKDLEVVNHPVIDSAKNIVGKQDYFDIIKFLSRSVEYLQDYIDLSKPNADKEWKQSIKDYEKRTGDKLTAVNEEEAPTGFMKPSSTAPSKRALLQLTAAQERFAEAVTMLARDIAEGDARQIPKAKDVFVFRNFAKELKLNSNSIQELTFISMRGLNFVGTDKEVILKLKKGLEILFKQDIVKDLAFLKPQEVDEIAKKSWQFAMSDDFQDNIKSDKFTDLLLNLNPGSRKEDITSLLNDLRFTRQENEFASKMKGDGWGNNTVLIQNHRLINAGSVKNILKFLQPYEGYDHPTSPDHHVNIKNDDSYEEVYQMRLTQRMRDRIAHLKDLEQEDKEKYESIKGELIKIGKDLINTIKYDEDQSYQFRAEDGVSIGEWCLVMEERATESALDFLARAESLEKDDLYNFASAYDDRIISTLSMLPVYYKTKNTPGYGPMESDKKNPKIKKIIKKSFAGFKKFLTAYDKIFTQEGFLDLKTEIKGKNVIDKRSKDFEKNVRIKSRVKFNWPKYSSGYIDETFYNVLTDKTKPTQIAYLENHLDQFGKRLNMDLVYIIPAAHNEEARDAVDGLALIDTFEKAKNYYHSWRREKYRRVLGRFYSRYKISYQDLTGAGSYIQMGSDEILELNKLNIEVTRNGDSRAGMPGIKPLVDEEDTKNPTSGEPLNRGDSMTWEQVENDAEQKRFNAFDWSVYPKAMKGAVAKELANKESSYGAFSIALDNVLKKVLSGKKGLEIEPLKREPEYKWGVDDRFIDDANTISTAPEHEVDTSYEIARQNHTLFNNMMVQGINYYVQRGQVNNLVGFLNNSGNAMSLKDAVLQAITRNKEAGSEPLDYDAALNLGLVNHGGWQGNNESAINSSMSNIFEKFDSLSLQKQLEIISKIDNKKIDEVYNKKKTKKAKGFQHPNKSGDTKQTESAVPDNSKIRMLNHLLADKMPASDLKKQMDAFFALPDPKMLRAFRDRRAESGDDACLRSILRSFIKRQMSDSQRKFINVNESKLNEYDDLEAEKTKIQDIVNKLDIEEEKDRELIDQIWRILNADHIQDVIGKLVVKPIADETAMNKEAATKVLTQVIYQIESSYEKIKDFLDDLEKTGSAYDVDALKKPINTLSNIFKSDVGYTVFKTLLPYGVGSNKKGPGEFALAMLSDRVQLSSTTGDVVIDGELVEVKASKSETSSGGGRLGMGGMAQLKARDILLRYKEVIPTVASHIEDANNKTLGLTNFVKYLNQDLPVGDKRRYDITKEFYKELFIPVAVEKIAKAFQSLDSDIAIALEYAGANYIDYLTRGKFEALLAIDMYTGKSAYLPNEEAFLDFHKGPHSGAMGISIVPSNSGPTESFVQMTFKKGKV